LRFLHLHVSDLRSTLRAESLLLLLLPPAPRSSLFPYTTLFRSRGDRIGLRVRDPEAPARRGFAGLKYFPYDPAWRIEGRGLPDRSEEHTSELQSLTNLVCRLLLEKKKTNDALSFYHLYTARRLD